jgi:signal transduction histidine kinase
MKALENLATSQDPPPSETLDLEFICSNGSTIWLETHLGILLNEDGEKIGMQGVSRDISDRKLAEALRDDVERMARHDLKTPLGAVVGLPGEIRRLGDLTKAQEGMLSTIEDAGNTMLHLINRSLDLFKMECGTYILKKKTVDILNILEQIKTETRPVMREKGISVGIEIQGTTSDKFLATVEEDLFKSMLSNLIINAIQASPEGGSISIVMERDKAVCRITICNHGEVAKPLRDVFFDKYSSSNESSGSGLGTYSARLIARTHGGEIKVNTNQPGKTCVSVTLP